MPVIDPGSERVPYQAKIYYPYQLFRSLPVNEADKLQEELQQFYFDQNPKDMQRIIERAKGNPDLVETYKDEAFNKIISTDYAYGVNILSRRRKDPLAQKLVEEINNYNMKSERMQQTQQQPAIETPE